MNLRIPLFFFDTYAFFEIIRGNPVYAVYKDVLAVTTIFNIAELNYGLKKETDGKTADALTQQYDSMIVEVTPKDVREAMTFRHQHKQFSIPDAIGYTIAQRLHIPFLTGDRDFQHFPHVIFIK